jgi:hypothetical protein
MPNELSGAQWVSRFPTSQSLDTLVEPFRTKAKKFLAALAAAKANVIISATFRPRERAYLMHYAFLIANGQIAASAVPPFKGVGITWAHPTNAKSVAAAQAMVDGYDIAFAPVLMSRHTDGLAIDMTITWTGDLAIKDANGKNLAVQTTPRTGMNKALWPIGATYGVIKLSSDPPHWSSDGH